MIFQVKWYMTFLSRLAVCQPGPPIVRSLPSKATPVFIWGVDHRITFMTASQATRMDRAMFCIQAMSTHTVIRLAFLFAGDLYGMRRAINRQRVHSDKGSLHSVTALWDKPWWDSELHLWFHSLLKRWYLPPLLLTYCTQYNFNMKMRSLCVKIIKIWHLVTNIW